MPRSGWRRLAKAWSQLPTVRISRDLEEQIGLLTAEKPV
jgi:hypothetical protein